MRVAPTLIEAAGGKPEPGTAPSLFQPFDKGALSELYLGNGVNRFSLVDGDLQLLWESRFAPPEPDYLPRPLRGDRRPAPAAADRARRRHLRPSGEGVRDVLPLTGRRGDPPKLTLVRWTPAGVQPVNDPDRVNASPASSRTPGWPPTAPRSPPAAPPAQPKLTPKEEEELKALGYVAGGD